MVGSAPDARCACPWLRLPRPADVVDAHAPGVEVDAHAHDVEAQALWQGFLGRERTAHAERRPVRDDVLVDERLEVVERHLETLYRHGQHGNGDGGSPSEQASTSSKGVRAKLAKLTQNAGKEGCHSKYCESIPS